MRLSFSLRWLTAFLIAFFFANLFSGRASLFAQKQESSAVEAAQKSLSELVDKIAERASSQSDTALSDITQSLRLILDFQPTDRRRFVLPRQYEPSKINADRLRKQLDASGDGAKLQNALEVLLEGIENEVAATEKSGDMATGYRMRWQAAGLQSILPATASGKNARRTFTWLHSDALRSAPDVRKSFANHPKTLWPAGAYSVASTAHFDIAFQSEPRAAAEVAILCEQTFALWKQIFYSYWTTKQTVAPEYAESLDHKFSVVLFKDRAAYMKALRSVPDIGVSTGFYDPNQKLALFYWDGNKTPSTVVHELTHQFFYEAGTEPVSLDTDRGAGFWVVESVALYMESLSTRLLGGSVICDVGGWDAPRLQASRYRRLHDKYWVPWEEFHSANGNRLRGEDDIRAWYSQAAGLAHLWLDGDKQREAAFVEYVDSVYANSEKPYLLQEWNDDQKLRDAYDRYLIHGPTASPSRPFFSNRRDAVLSRSKISSQQLLAWPIEYRTTPWLDLSFSQVDDAMFVKESKTVEPSWNVQRLNLESTKVTDKALPIIAQNKNLTELDLSLCPISDMGLNSLKEHKSLKSLWLNQTEVSDRSIDVLLSIPQLEAVHLAKSKVSVQGWERLLAAKPRLKLKSTGP